MSYTTEQIQSMSQDVYDYANNKKDFSRDERLRMRARISNSPLSITTSAQIEIPVGYKFERYEFTGNLDCSFTDAKIRPVFRIHPNDIKGSVVVFDVDIRIDGTVAVKMEDDDYYFLSGTFQALFSRIP